MKKKFAVITVITLLIILLPACSLKRAGKTFDNSQDDSSNLDIDGEVLAQGDNYILVYDSVETYTGTTEYIGVMNNNGDWVVKESDQNYLTQLDRSQQDLLGNWNDAHYYYLGDGIFLGSYGVDLFLQDGSYIDIGNCISAGSRRPLEVYFYNVKSDSGFKLNVFEITEIIDGYFLASDDENVYKYDTQGNRKLLVEDASLGGPLSEDLFYVNGGYFYDINGNLQIDISSFDIHNGYERDGISYLTHFVNEKCYIEFDNPNGTTYHVEIDKKGEFLYEPKSV